MMLKWLRKRVEEVDPYFGFSADDFSGVALDMIFGKIPRTSNSFHGGSIEECDEAIAKAARLRAEYADLEPRRLRTAVMGWIDFYQNRAEENREDILTQRRRKEMVNRDRQAAKRADRVQELKEAIEANNRARREAET